MKKHFFNLFVATFLFVSNVFAQNTLHYMPIHQIIGQNPAFQSEYRLFIGIPVLNSINLGLSTDIAWNDVFTRGTGAYKDSLLFDLENVENRLATNNYVKFNFDVSLLAFGFWIRENYFSFDISNRTFYRLRYPRDPFTFVMKGNAAFVGEGNAADLGNWLINTTNYTEIAFGLSRKIADGLIIGGRLKYLRGTACLETENSSMKIYTYDDNGQYALKVVSEGKYRASFPVKIFRQHVDETISDIDSIKIEEDEIENNYTSNFLGNNNHGFAVDLGATYEYGIKWQFSASITDFGFINWQSNPLTLEQKGTFNFDGVAIDSLFNEFKGKKRTGYAKMYQDSLEKAITIADDSTNFTSWLPSSIYVGAMYKFTPSTNIALLSRTDYYDKGFHPTFTFSFNTKLNTRLSASFTYSYLNNNFEYFGTVGMGFTLRLGCFQWYIASDNALAPLFPKAVTGYNLHFGMNLVFPHKTDYTLEPKFDF